MTRGAFICFDLDNTLIHADPAHVAAYRLALKHYGYPLPQNKEILDRMGIVGRKIIEAIYPQMTEEEVTRIIKKHHYYLMHKTYKKVTVIRGAHKAVENLRDAGHKLAIVTNCKHRTMLLLMRHTGFDRKLFVARIGNDQVLHPKPAPDEIHKAEHLAHLKADYMVGDTIYDIVASRKARVPCLSVLTGHQPRSLLQKYKPYKIFKSVADIPSFIEKDFRSS